MSKNRFAKGGPGGDALQELLGSGAAEPLPVGLIQIIPGFNPRTSHLSEKAREQLFSDVALAPLAESMAERLEDGEPRGVLQPLLVRPAGRAYHLIAGERRLRAARLAGLTHVPAFVRQLSDAEARRAAVIENAQRQDVDLVSETMSGFALMQDRTGLSEAELLTALGNARQNRGDPYGLDDFLRQTFGTGVATWSTVRSRVLKLTEGERLAVQQGVLTAKAAFLLISLGPELRRRALQELLRVHEGEALGTPEVQALLTRLAPSLPPPPSSTERVRQALPQLKKLSGPKRERADALIEELLGLLK